MVALGERRGRATSQRAIPQCTILGSVFTEAVRSCSLSLGQVAMGRAGKEGETCPSKSRTSLLLCGREAGVNSKRRFALTAPSEKPPCALTRLGRSSESRERPAASRR